MNKQVSGNIAAIAAFVVWGALPLYWGLLEAVSPFLVLAYRVVFSLLLLSVILLFSRWRKEIRRVLSNRKRALTSLAASLLVFSNWALFIWGLDQGLHIEVSFGYYLSPLVTVALGALVLKEKMKGATIAAFVLAMGAVAYLLISSGSFPWYALALAVTFAVYGLVKKKVETDAYTGLFLETVFSAPLAVGIMIYFAFNGGIVFGQQWGTSLLLVGCGLMTTTPLILYSAAAQRIPLSSLGFFQYLSPSITLLVGVFVYGKHIPQHEMIGFITIWIALIIYSAGAVFRIRKSRAAARMEQSESTSVS